MRKVTLLYLILLTYANLSPKVPSAGVAGGDKIAHFLEFLILGLVSRDKSYMIFPVLFETLQLFVPGRSFSFLDMSANLIGFGVGYLLWRWWNESADRRA
ncbi:MAG: VanZ family protein [Thermococcus sp.]|uniref:VanZ family protein n=1 Tax=Thermococcus sp. TaxID=35749 RepID=UPI000BCB7B9C|nr:VanZ family protein [Thermococcus sp.]OYT32778.1 MAG: VanZ family protein [Archaeoglobales archaeon ex4484_92]RLF75008.1 MAG: VanZ family protein [Thermococci archaeon]HDO71364.1 VanZ family protein [bacterium]MCD6140177.1 VanZ family protein [Thermococcus sp.]MCD6143220.1 VanZ family protein [Thermococcus sp.]